MGGKACCLVEKNQPYANERSKSSLLKCPNYDGILTNYESNKIQNKEEMTDNLSSATNSFKNKKKDPPNHRKNPRKPSDTSKGTDYSPLEEKENCIDSSRKNSNEEKTLSNSLRVSSSSELDDLKAKNEVKDIFLKGKPSEMRSHTE